MRAVWILIYLSFIAASPDRLCAAPETLLFDPAIISTGMRLAPISSDEVSLIMDLSRETPMEVSVFADPPRIVLELPKVVFPAKKDHTNSSGPVKSYRYGLFTADRSRVIIDLDGHALVERIDTVELDAGKRTVVTLKRTDPQSFTLAVRESSANLRYTGTVKTINVAQKDAPDEQKNVLPLVVLDPGHGGIDPGAAGPNGELEKNLVLTISQMLKAKLETGGKVRVEMTRTSDVFVQLADRVQIARAKSAALFVSLHADTLNNEPNVRGATLYTLSDKASDGAAAQLAEKENRVDQLAGIKDSDNKETVSDILFDLARRETRVFSLEFAKILIARIQNSQALGLTMINKNPHRFASFKVLKAPDVPSVLFELGYLSSAEDARDLNSKDWQNKLTDAAAEAIVKFAEGRGR